MKAVAALALAALLGGGVAFGIGTAVWDGGGTTTVVQTAPASPTGLASDTVQQPAGDAGAGNVGRIYRAAAPGVVQVTSNVQTSDPFFGTQSAQALGSGFVMDKLGHIITNYHVVQGANDVFVNFSGNDRMKAKIVGTDPSTDVAVLKIDASTRALTPLPLGNSDAVRVGDPVVAIGNPFGLDRTVTAGIVSALQRQIQSPNGFPIDKVVQTDAAINKGNSGGPLLDSKGRVIGINSQIESDDEEGGNIGIGFAIPINTVKEVASELIDHGKVDHPFLGIQMQTIDQSLAQFARVPDKGVLVTEVVPSSPAAKAGLKGGSTSVVVDGQTYRLGGDVITSVGGREVTSADEVQEIVTSKQPGDQLTLQLQRDGSEKTVTVTLGRRPADSG
ncbi:MAG TPA: trypsin-like peptidase domain-containing protein [Gaiellaceae bacterium]